MAPRAKRPKRLRTMAFILFLGFIIFLAAICLHIAVWRWRHPQNHPLALLAIFILLPFAFFIACIALTLSGKTAWAMASTDLLAAYLLNFSFSAAYILSYPAVQAASPSLVIVLMIGNSGAEGLLRGDLAHVFDDDVVLGPRIEDLVKGGLVTVEGGYYRLTSKGTVLIRFFVLMRYLLSLPRGRG